METSHRARPGGVLVVLVLWGCGPGSDHERRGDEAYGAGRFTEALTEYRSALKSSPDGRVWAKAGAAAYHAGDLETASDSYLRLAAEDPTRAEEAAEGLEMVARAAERGGDTKRLESAVIGLGAIAPQRSVGRYALTLLRKPGAQASDLVNVLPAAIAVAPDAEAADSLLAVYAVALRETASCDQALPLFQATLRRTKMAPLRTRAEEGVAACSLALGIRSEAGGKYQDATLWYAAAIRVDSSTAVGRRALIGYGDARLKLGDTIAGALAFQAVASDRVQSDSISHMAQDRLSALRAAPFNRPVER
jgi:tetratricopeptide (TPR) repeat protein